MIRGIDGRAGAITWHPHNRATIARRNPTPPLQWPKKLPAFEFWQVFPPPQPPTGCPDGWLVDISMGPKHLCLEALVRPEHVRVATHNGGWRGGVKHKIVQNSSPGAFFSQRTLFGIRQSKLTLPPTSHLCIYTILSIQKRQKRVPLARKSVKNTYP